MPECYTHAAIAARALERCGLQVAQPQAFLAGSHGPDALYLYQLWRRHPRPDLPAVAQQMHTSRTGEVLLALHRQGATAAQQSYVLGYVTHYIADCILLPYFAAMQAKGAPYGGKSARVLPAAVDGYLYGQTHKDRKLNYAAGVPVLTGEVLAGVVALLHNVILEQYGQDVPAVALADTFHHNRTLRRLMVSPAGGKKMVARLLGPRFASTEGWGSARHHFQPAPPLRALPASWRNPYTGQQLDETLDDVVQRAVEVSALGLRASLGYWRGEVTEEALAEMFGSNDMHTGCPPEEEAAAPTPAAEAPGETPAKTPAEVPAAPPAAAPPPGKTAPGKARPKAATPAKHRHTKKAKTKYKKAQGAKGKGAAGHKAKHPVAPAKEPAAAKVPPVEPATDTAAKTIAAPAGGPPVPTGAGNPAKKRRTSGRLPGLGPRGFTAGTHGGPAATVGGAGARCRPGANRANGGHFARRARRVCRAPGPACRRTAGRCPPARAGRLAFGAVPRPLELGADGEPKNHLACRATRARRSARRPAACRAGTGAPGRQRAAKHAGRRRRCVGVEPDGGRSSRPAGRTAPIACGPTCPATGFAARSSRPAGRTAPIARGPTCPATGFAARSSRPGG